MSTITINGKSYSGNNIVVKNNKVIIDGVEATPDESKVISINVQGDVNALSVDSAQTVIVNGNTGSLKTVSGDVRCADISGNVNTISGDVKANIIKGSVSTISGDIEH